MTEKPKDFNELDFETRVRIIMKKWGVSELKAREIARVTAGGPGDVVPPDTKPDSE